MSEHNKEYIFYIINSEKLLYIVRATIINSNNDKLWDGKKFDFQSCHIILFKIFSFKQQKHYEP